MALLLNYKDSKISYQSLIKLKPEIDLKRCVKNHPKWIKKLIKQDKPFVCSSCVNFYDEYENHLTYQVCQACNSYFCYRCIIEDDKDKVI